MGKFGQRGTALVAALALMAASTSAAAAAPVEPAPVNPWAALAMLSSGTSAIAYCGAAATAAVQPAGQPAAGCVLPQVDAPPAPLPGPSVMVEPLPPPLPGAAAGVSIGFNPLYLLIGAAALGALAYFLLKGKGNNEPNSPT